MSVYFTSNGGNMFESFSRSWQLVKYSWAFLRRNKAFMWFPIFSGLATLAASIVLLLPAGIVMGLFAMMSGGRNDDTGTSIFGYILLFAYYMVVYTISIYFNVALAGAVMKELDTGDATVQDGMAIARGKMSLILQYAAISSTVGIVMNAIRERGGFIGSIVASLGGMAWNLLTFFVIPLLVIEDKGIVDLIKDSGSLLKRTFGEQVAGGFGVGAVMFLAMMVVMVAGIALIALFSSSGLLVGLVIALMIAGFIAIGLIGGTLTSIYRVLVFRYAQAGTIPSDMDVALLQGAFKEKKKRG